MANQIRRKLQSTSSQINQRKIETKEDREIRINALALRAKLDPLLGKFYTTPDLTSDAITANLSQVNIRRLNEAYNNLRTKKPLDDKQKEIVTGVVKAMLILNFKPIQTFLGQDKYQAFLTIIGQSFVDTYGNAFKLPELEAPAEVDDALKSDGEKPDGSESSNDSGASDSGDSGDSKSSDDTEADAGSDESSDEGSDEEAEEGSEEADTGEEADDEAEDLESTSAETPEEKTEVDKLKDIKPEKPKANKVIRYTDAPTFITTDLISFLQAMDWDAISRVLVELHQTEGFTSESSANAGTRITFRKAKRLRHFSDDLCYLYEIVCNGKVRGLIHSTNESGNSVKRRMWRVMLASDFNDAKYRTGFSNTEPFTLLNSRGRLVLHNPIVMTMSEARAWVRTAIEV